MLLFHDQNIKNQHCVKSVQIRSFFWSAFSCIRTEYGDLRSKFIPNTEKYGPEKTPVFGQFLCSATNGESKLYCNLKK